MPTFANIQEEIANMLDVPDEELTEEQQTLMNSYLDELAQQEASKVDGFAGFIRKQSAIAEAMKKEADHLAAKAKAVKNRIDYLKRHYLAVMRLHGVKKIAGEIYSISARENARVEVDDLDALLKYDGGAGMFVKTEVTYKPDKNIIKESLKDGIAVPGCKLEKSFSLNIR